jgi:two-component system OmpR family sensor kinase
MFKFFRRNEVSSSQKVKVPDNQSESEQVSINIDSGHKKDFHPDRRRVKTDLLIHDLKVPLAVIEAGIVSLLRRVEKYGSLTEKQEKVLVRVLRNTKVAKRLVNDALELGRSRKGIVDITNFSLSGLIGQTLVEIFDLADSGAAEKIRSCVDLALFREVLEEKGILLHIDERLWCQEICQDEAKLTQILRNLLNNALKYRKSRVILDIDRKEDYLILLVTDDGEGIPSVYHKKIFESYFQIDGSGVFTVRGHGLGLAGVMALVEDMGGQISLESEEGKGAKFSVKVPLSSNTEQ